MLEEIEEVAHLSHFKLSDFALGVLSYLDQVSYKNRFR